jgi:hypothetical protein
VEIEGGEKPWRTLTEVAVALREQVEVVVVDGPNNPIGFGHGGLEVVVADLPVDLRSQLVISDTGVEHESTQLAEEQHLFIRGTRHRATELFELAPGPRVRGSQASALAPLSQTEREFEVLRLG